MADFCTQDPWGPVRTADCATLQLTDVGNTSIIDQYANEQLLIAGADINVFKLMGVQAQGRLTDVTGRGIAISSGDQPTYESANVFDLNTCGEWRSLARGSEVTQKAFIGYNFGEIKLANGRNQYGVVTYVQHHIDSIRIQQGENKQNRATKARVEHSVDGITWRGAAVITLADDADAHTITFAMSTSAKFWRLRPLAFNGGSTDYWVVRALDLIEAGATSLSNVQDEWGILENRDRVYSKNSIRLKATYDLVDIQTMLARFGMETTDEFTLQFHFLSMVASLGRPLVIGDVLEIPSQIQYSADMTPVKKYLSVTQTAWAVNGFTPGWKPTILKVIAAPMLASQETMDIVGDFAGARDMTGFLDIDTEKYNDMASILNQKSDAKARELVPERGEDDTGTAVLSPELIDAANALGNDIEKLVRPQTNEGYVHDAMPPGGGPYTEADVYPAKPKDGDYHRLTYNGIDATIPARLFRYSVRKNSWIYMESDERKANTIHSTRIANFLGSKTRQSITEIK
jgi:hypothetical protein